MARGVSFSGTTRKISTLIEWFIALIVVALLALGAYSAAAALGLIAVPEPGVILV